MITERKLIGRTADHLELDLDEIKTAKVHSIKFAQESIVEELVETEENRKGRFRKLAPKCDADGIWRVGSRQKEHEPCSFYL